MYMYIYSRLFSIMYIVYTYIVHTSGCGCIGIEVGTCTCIIGRNAFWRVMDLVFICAQFREMMSLN